MFTSTTEAKNKSASGDDNTIASKNVSAPKGYASEISGNKGAAPNEGGQDKDDTEEPEIWDKLDPNDGSWDETRGKNSNPTVGTGDSGNTKK